jgi:hypothetical protein
MKPITTTSILGNASTDEPEPKLEGTDVPRPSEGPAKIEPTPEKAREAKQRQEQQATRR